MGKFRKKTIAIFLIMFLIGINIFAFIAKKSFSADNENVILESNLEKYVNYSTQNKKGTLVQYDVKAGIEYKENYVPVKDTELTLNLNKIDGVLPDSVKVIANSTKVTNGKTDNITPDYTYDSTSGTVVIKASNENENGEAINNNQSNQDDRDSYTVICDYNAYISDKKERELTLDAKFKAKLFTDDNREITGTTKVDNNVTENIGDIVSVSLKADDIYNGIIKSNIINKTETNTKYNENSQIMISKKDAMEKLKINLKDDLVNVSENNGEQQVKEIKEKPIYKTITFNKTNVENIFGEEVSLEIFDNEENLLFTINKDTQYDESGNFTYTYEKELNEITMKTTAVANEGTLNIKIQNEVPGTMKDINGTNIRNTVQVDGLDTEENSVFKVDTQNLNEIKDATTQVEASVSKIEWTNEQQNDVTFGINLNSTSPKYNLFKNPTITINMPSQVEKVVIDNSQLMYANGLSIKNIDTKTNEDGGLIIVAELAGTQSSYDESNLGLSTNLQISAKVILKKDIESTSDKVKIVYTNENSTTDKKEEGTIEQSINIKSYNQSETNEINNDNVATINENKPTVEAKIQEVTKEAIVQATAEEVNGLKLTVEPTKGDGTIIKDGDTIYTGEIIKYTVKIQNTTDKVMDNVKVIGSIPEGMTYGELDSNFDSFETSKYNYNWNENVREKQIDVGTIKAGETVTKYYEAKVDDLTDNENEKQISTNVKTYINSSEASIYVINNKIEKGDANIFVSSLVSGVDGEIKYIMNYNFPEGKEATIKLVLPEVFNVTQDDILKGNANLIINDGSNNTTPGDINGNKYEIDKNVLIINPKESGTASIEFKYKDDTELRNKIEDGKVELKGYATISVKDSDIVYKSNENRLIYQFESVDIKMSSDNEGEKVKYGDEINYNIQVTCTGISNTMDSYKGIYVNVIDYLPKELDPETVTYDDYELNYVTKDDMKYADGFKEKQIKTEDINYRRTDDNGNALPDSDVYVWIPYKETVNIKITTKAGYVTKDTEIENSATVKDVDQELQESEEAKEPIKTKTSNIIKHTILSSAENGSGDSGNTDVPETPDNPDNPNTPSNPDTPNNPNDPNSSENTNNSKYSISGIAWNDENQDGIRQSEEPLLDGINVMLVDLKNQNDVKSSVTTQNGRYTFTNLDNGNYLVVFKYDTSKYKITKYKASGSNENNNSDAQGQNITLAGQQVYVGVTDTINLTKSVSNLDIGLIENSSGYDLKLDKYITEVSVKTNKGTKQYSYNDVQLAKVDIKAKELDGATVTVKYKIVVTNEGKVSKKVKEVADYLPNGMQYTTAGNSGWEKQSDKLINRSLTNQEIKAGESKTLYLTLTKKMTSENTGTFVNSAEINSVDESDGMKDVDSTPGNKKESEDDYSKAQLIISVNTGLAMYISIGVIIATIIGLTALGIKFKWKIGKISKMGLSVLVIVMAGMIITYNPVEAVTYHYTTKTTFWYIGEENGVGKFSGGPMGTGWCTAHGIPALGESGICNIDPTNGYTFSGTNSVSVTKRGSRQVVSDKINLKKLNSKIEVKQIGDYYILGPFKTSSNSTEKYKITVMDKTGYRIDNWSTCDANGNTNGGVNGGANVSFYLKINASQYGRGIGNVTVEQNKKYEYKNSYEKSGKVHYVAGYGDHIHSYTYNGVWITKQGHQPVNTSYYVIETGEEYGSENTTGKITWTDFSSSLDIMKVDADDPSVKIDIEGTIQNKSGTWKQNFKTTNGVAHFDNLESEQEYIVTETINTNYGYEGQVGQKINFIVHSGSLYKIRFKNSCELGNLELNKQDATTGKKLENVGFKIQDSNGKYIIAIDEKNQKQSKVTGEISLGNMQTTDNKEEATEFLTDKDGTCKIYRIKTGTYTVEEISVKDTDYGYDTDDDYVTWNVDGKSQNKGTKATVTVERQRSYNTRTKSSIITDNKKAVEDGVYEIETGTKSNFAVDVRSTNVYDKSNVSVYEKNKSIAQQFYLQYLGNGAYKIISMVANKCLDAYGGAKDGTNVELYPDNNTEAQKWYLETTCSKGKATNGCYFVRAGNYYLDIENGVTNTANYTNIRLWQANGSKAQQFKFNSLTQQAQTGNTVTKVTFNNTRKYIKLSGYVWEDMVSGKQSTRDNLYNGDSDAEKNDKLVANVKVRLKDKDGSYVKFKTEDGKIVDEILTDSNGSYKMVDILIDKLKDYYIEFEYNGMSYQSVATDLYKSNGSKATDANTREEFNNKYATISNNQASNKSGQKSYDLRYKSENHTSTLIYGDNPVYGYQGQNFPINNVDEQYIMRANTRDAYLADKNSQNKYTGYLTDRYSEETIRKQAVEEIDNINLGLYERERPDLALIEDVESAKLTLNGYEHTYKYAQRFENTADTGDGFNVAVKFGNKYGSASYTRNIYSSDAVYNKQPGNSGKLQAYVTYKIAIRNESTNLYAKVDSIVNYFDSNYDISSIKNADNEALQYQVDQNYGTKNGYKRVIINTNENIDNQKENYVYIEYKLNNSAINSVLNQKLTLNSVTEINSYSVYSDDKYTQSYAGIDQDSNPGSAIPTDRDSYEDDTDSAPSFILDVQEGRVIRGTVWEDDAIDALLRKSGYEKERKGDGVYQKAKENVVKNVKVELLQVGEDGKTTATSLYQFDKASKTENVKLASEMTASNGSYEFSGVIPGNYVIKYTYGDSSVIFDVNGKQIDTVKARDYKSTIYRNGLESNVKSDDGLWYREETGDKAARWSDARDYTGIYKDGTTTDIVKLRTQERTLDNKEITNDKNLINIEAKTEKINIKMDYDVNKDNTSEYGADLKFVFDNIDFGIIKRPQQISTMEKSIKHIKVTLANGQVIIDGDPSKDNLQHVKMLPDGRIHIELDSELMQGANVELTYGITVDNRASEIDYNDENYYIYGIIPSNKESSFRLSTVLKVFDYLSNDLVYDKNTSEKNKDWTEVTETPDELLSSGKIANEKVRDALKKYNRIFQTDKFKDMTPGTTKTVEMVVTKVLANTQDDMTYCNDAEVIEVGNEPSKGTDLTESTPGNYVPTYGGSDAYENQGEGDDSYSEITVTVPTGENKNYIPYIIMGVSGFIILAVGVIFIKRKVL